jgi:hypothetical protein
MAVPKSNIYQIVHATKAETMQPESLVMQTPHRSHIGNTETKLGASLAILRVCRRETVGEVGG